MKVKTLLNNLCKFIEVKSMFLCLNDRISFSTVITTPVANWIYRNPICLTSYSCVLPHRTAYFKQLHLNSQGYINTSIHPTQRRIDGDSN